MIQPFCELVNGYESLRLRRSH